VSIATSAHRVRQVARHLRARVAPDELELVRRILSPSAAALFDGMPVADQRHALDVATRLLAGGADDPDVLAAALLHDVAKGHRMRLWHRVWGVLLQAAAPRLLQRLASPNPRSWRYPVHLHLHHAAMSAEAARAAGCSDRCAAFIRGISPEMLLQSALNAADEAS
jgi:hypothetical protein